MNEKIYIYTLKDQSGIRYVGQTNNLSIRLSSHKCNGGRGRDKTNRGLWIKHLMDNGKVPIMEVVEECFSENSNERERFWVNHFHNQGCSLLNGLYKLEKRVMTPTSLTPG